MESVGASIDASGTGDGAAGDMRDANEESGGGIEPGSEVPAPTNGARERVPLKTVLQNFLNHVENLEARRREGDDAYEKEFQSLKLFSDQLKCQPEYSSAEGEKDVNRKKNRYKDILPCESFY